MSAKELKVPLEFEFANDAFALVPEYTEDGERRQREIDEHAAALKAQNKAQLKLPEQSPKMDKCSDTNAKAVAPETKPGAVESKGSLPS